MAEGGALPDAWELVYRAALGFARSAAVEEVLANLPASMLSYSKVPFGFAQNCEEHWWFEYEYLRGGGNICNDKASLSILDQKLCASCLVPIISLFKAVALLLHLPL